MKETQCLWTPCQESETDRSRNQWPPRHTYLHSFDAYFTVRFRRAEKARTPSLPLRQRLTSAHLLFAPIPLHSTSALCLCHSRIKTRPLSS